jgi:diguanylate cyclase (GGDEF)-like protein
MKDTSLAALIGRLAVCESCDESPGAGETMDVLTGTVAADCYAVLRVRHTEDQVDVLGGRGLILPDIAHYQGLESPHIIKQALNFPGEPAIALLGSFTCDPFLDKENARSLLMARKSANDVHMVTIAFRRQGDAFNDEEVERFGVVAGVINLLAKSWHLEKSLRVISEKDTLTGLFKFTGFHSSLAREIARARRNDGSVAVGILTLDTGNGMPDDESILSASGIMREQLRSFDILARYGPDELSFALPDLNLEEGVQVSKRLLGQLKESENGTGKAEYYLGLSSYPQDASTTDRLIEIAEAAMSEARDAGTPGVFTWEHDKSNPDSQ